MVSVIKNSSIYHLILFFALNLMAIQGRSQYNITINGQVLDDESNPISGVFVTADVLYDIIDLAVPSSFTSTDDNGQFIFELDLADTGCAEVYIMDCGFSEFPQQVCWTENNQVFDVEYTYCEGGTQDTICDALIFEAPSSENPNSEVELGVISFGTAPFLYSWDNGSTANPLLITESGDYCVTVIDAFDCSWESCISYQFMSACEGYIYVDYTAETLSFISISEDLDIAWSTGDEGPILQVTTPGEYCAEVTGSDCLETYCFEYLPEIEQCNVYIYQGYLQDTITELIALAEGVEPFTYSWNTNELGSSIFVPTIAGDQYCVTVTDNIGCDTETCYILDNPQHCGVIIYDEFDLSNVLIADAWGIEPIEFTWSTGESTSEIIIEESGDYCVTISDAIGCTEEFCFYKELEIQDTICQSYIYLDEGGTNEGVGFIIDDYAALPGDVVCVEVKVKNFNDIIGFQGNIVWDPSILTYVNVNAFGLPDMNLSNFNPSEPGMIRFVYLGNLLLDPITVEDNYSIFEICFDVIGNEGDYTSIEMLDTPFLVLEVVGQNSEALPYYVDNGGVHLSTEIIDSGTEGQDLLIAVINDGTPPFSYEWNTGSNLNAIVPTQSGEYCITIYDGVGCQTESCFYYESEESCSTQLHYYWEDIDNQIMEFISVETIGEAPFTYQWSTGELSETIMLIEAQEYCVTVTDAVGCNSFACDYFSPLSECNADIFIESNPEDGLLNILTVQTEGVPPFTYIWSTGEDIETIIVSEPGEYCVTILDSNDCEDQACIFVGESNCSVSIEELPHPGIGSDLIAHAEGVSNEVDYLWSTGDTVPQISVFESGLYCVEITDLISECSTSNCYNYDNGCYFDFEVNEVETGVFSYTPIIPDFLTVQFWDWSHDSIQSPMEGYPPSIIVEESGEYCLTIDFAEFCVVTECIELEGANTFPGIFNSDQEGVINGLVVDSLFTGLSGFAILYEVKEDTIVAVDSTSLDRYEDVAYFNFENVTEGNYIIKAIPENEDWIPVYHVSSLIWENATVISFDGSYYLATILFFESVDTDGEGIIQGNTVDNGFDGQGSPGFTTSSSGPLSNIQVLLLDEFYNPIQSLISDENGYFIFDQLPWGNYIILMEEAGEKHYETFINLSPDNPNEFVELGEIGFFSNTDELESEYKMSTFPNPVRENLFIKFDQEIDSKSIFQIVDALGHLVRQYSLEQVNSNSTFTFNIKDLEEGAYFMRWISKDGYRTASFIKVD